MKSSFLFRCVRYCLSISILLLLLSSGCSMYKSRSKCKLQSTISCQPVSKINELINENRLEDFTRQQNCKGKPCRAQRTVSKEEQVISKKGEWAEVYFNSYVDDFGVRRRSYALEFVGFMSALRVFKDMFRFKAPDIEQSVMDMMHNPTPRSSMFPYLFFDTESGIYHMQGGVVGFVLEASPIVGCDSNAYKQISMLFDDVLPEGGVLEVLLLASDDLSIPLEAWKAAQSFAK